MTEETKEQEDLTKDWTEKDYLKNLYQEDIPKGLGKLFNWLGSTFGVGFLVLTYLFNPQNTELLENIKQIKSSQKREIPVAKYVNNDKLVDLVYTDGTTYLQTPEGTFVEYNKAKVDSIYKAREDSIKQNYNSELQKKLDEISKEKESQLEKVVK